MSELWDAVGAMNLMDHKSSDHDWSVCVNCKMNPADPRLGRLCAECWCQEERSGLWLGPVLLVSILMLIGIGLLVKFVVF